jgi:beta-fructofuranosidase
MASDLHRPVYHFLPTANWMNDPNGLIYWRGQYHLFYQYNPGSAVWGNIHWGHASSDDLLHWQDLPIALTPTPEGCDRDGCWSGCAVIHDGVPTLVYTGWREEMENVCVAYSHDELMTWVKYPANPVINGPPPGMVTTGFRDPYVWWESTEWRMVLGAGIEGYGGAVLLYRSGDLHQWDYLGILLAGDSDLYGTTWECPNFFRLGDRYVLVVSQLGANRVHYFSGKYRANRFIADHSGLVDDGRCFYAPQVFMDKNGRALMMGWVQEERAIEAHRAAGWAGVQSVPRQLALTRDGRLENKPVQELNTLRGERYSFVDAMLGPGEERELPVNGDRLDIEVELEAKSFDAPVGQPGSVFGMAFYRSNDGSEETILSVDLTTGKLVLDRRRSSSDIQVSKDILEAPLGIETGSALSLRIFLDRSVVEVFTGQGRCLTARLYPISLNKRGIKIFALEGSIRVRSMLIWQMHPIWPIE